MCVGARTVRTSPHNSSRLAVGGNVVVSFVVTVSYFPYSRVPNDIYVCAQTIQTYELIWQLDTLRIRWNILIISSIGCSCAAQRTIRFSGMHMNCVAAINLSYSNIIELN